MATCSLCEQSFIGYGNNPYPLCDEDDYEATCCDTCNIYKVVPARLKQMGVIITPEMMKAAIKKSEEDEDDYVKGWINVDGDTSYVFGNDPYKPNVISLPRMLREDVCGYLEKKFNARVEGWSERHNVADCEEEDCETCCRGKWCNCDDSKCPHCN
jgi:hypothetical protein